MWRKTLLGEVGRQPEKGRGLKARADTPRPEELRGMGGETRSPPLRPAKRVGEGLGSDAEEVESGRNWEPLKGAGLGASPF